MKKVLLILLASSSIFLQAQKIDSESGLIIAKGFETVKANCTVCHSAKFITTQKGDRKHKKEYLEDEISRLQKENAYLQKEYFELKNLEPEE